MPLGRGHFSFDKQDRFVYYASKWTMRLTCGLRRGPQTRNKAFGGLSPPYEKRQAAAGVWPGANDKRDVNRMGVTDMQNKANSPWRADGGHGPP
jgi:hypothetical protein